MGSTDLDCSVDILSLLSQFDLNGEMPLPSPVDSVHTSTFTPYSSMTSALNGGAQPPHTVGSRRRPQLCSAISLPDSFHAPPMASATTVPQQLLSPELRFHSTPATLEDMFAAAYQMHPQYGMTTPTEFGAKPQYVAAAAGDASRRAFSIDDAQSFAETLRRSSAAMAHAMHQQALSDTIGDANRKLSSASSSSFDVETANSISQQLQQQPSVRYKTELCRPYEEHGSCRYGSKCQFAHGRGELRNVSRHPKYKTEMCRTFHTTGYCPYGIRCHFIHETAVAADHQSNASSNTATDMAAVENSFCHRLAGKSSSSVDEQTHQMALQKDVERRRSTLMQMHLQQMKPSQHLNDAIPVGIDHDRRISISNYNQAMALPLPLEKSTSFDVVFPDVSSSSPYERIPPPPGLSMPVDVAADAVTYGQRSTGSSPTSEFTSGFGSGGSSGDVNSGPGSPATALASAGFQFFQQPAVCRSKQVHPTLSSSVALPVAPNEPSVAAASYMMNHHYMENPEVKPLLTTVFPEQNTSNRAPDNILQQQQLQRLSAAVDQSVGPIWSDVPDLSSSTTPWLSNDLATVQQVGRDDMDSLQMVASLKPDELAKLIQLVKLCGTSSSPCSSGDLSIDVSAKVVVPSRQSSITGHQPVPGTSNYAATLGNVASYSNISHTSPAACW